MANGPKRKFEGDGGDGQRSKQNKKPQKGYHARKDHASKPGATIQPGDAGIWATCDKGREGKCVSELRDLFGEYVTEMYGQASGGGENQPDDEPGDVETDIQKELASLKNREKEVSVQSIKLDVQCVLFFRTAPPIDPARLVQRICSDAQKSGGRQRTRFAKRLTPMTLMGKATEKDLKEVAQKVLAPHFHNDETKGLKFAIRPTTRNHSTLTRETIISTVASVVGPGHQVDLKNYDRLILVEIYKNICGISVVGNEFETLKRYNLAELASPPQEKGDGGGDEESHPASA